MPELVQDPQRCCRDEQQPGAEAERDAVGHRRLGRAEVRQDAQLLEVEVDETVDDAEGRVEPRVQPAVGAGGFGGVLAPDTEADPDLRDPQGAEGEAVR